jgi:hypothetical protein
VVTAIAVAVRHGSLASQIRPRRPVEQSVLFSHKHQMGEIGLDCRCCHVSVEDPGFAGMPPTHTRMSWHA